MVPSRSWLVGLSDPVKILLLQEMKLMGGLIGGSENKNNHQKKAKWPHRSEGSCSRNGGMMIMFETP